MAIFDVNATGDMSQPWNFAAAYYLFVVTFLIIAGHLLLVLVSLCRVPTHPAYEVRFQALELRITAFFPVFAVLTTIAAFWPWISSIIDIVFALVEGYIVIMFFALFTGRGWTGVKGVSYPDALMDHPRSNKVLPWSSPFPNGNVALSTWRNLAVQFTPVKTLMAIITLALANRNGGIIPTNEGVILRVISTISLLIALLSLIRVYRGSANAPGEPFKGHYLVTKFLIVKILFTFIVFNNLILKNLLEVGKIPINPWLCEDVIVTANPLNREYCESRVVSVVFLFEILVVAVFAYVWFRPHAPDQIARADGVDPAHDGGRTVAHPMLALLCHMLNPFDLHQFWEGKVGGASAASVDAMTAKA